MAGTTETYTWKDRELQGPDGEKIGTISEIYEDSATGKPEWALVKSGLFGTRSHFVPLAGAQLSEEGVRANVTKDQVKEAPSVEGGGELSQAEERQLFDHYAIPYTREGSTTAKGAPGEADDRAAEPSKGTGQDTSGPDTDEAMTRSEDELRVGSTQRESDRVRLRRYVVTEQVQTTVPVQREEIRVERDETVD